MAQQLHNSGELFVLDNVLTTVSYEIGLFDDSSDQLSDSATYAAITTEPTGSSYAPQTESNSVTQLNANNDGQLVIDPVSFDVSDSSVTVDSIYIRDAASGDLIATNAIGSQDLSTRDANLRISNAGFSLD